MQHPVITASEGCSTERVNNKHCLLTEHQQGDPGREDEGAGSGG